MATGIAKCLCQVQRTAAAHSCCRNDDEISGYVCGEDIAQRKKSP